MDTFNTVLFIAAAVLCGLYFVSLFMRRQPLDKPVSARAYYILLFAVAALAVAARVYRFGTVPAGINQDGAMAAVDAKALADYGTDRFGMRWPVHLTAWGFGQMSALLSYLMIPFIKLFGLTAAAVRLPTLLVSLGGLACLFLFTKDVLGRNSALAVLFFGAVAPWHFVQSRWALDCNLFPHFFMAGVYFLNRGVERGKVSIAVSMLMFALCMYSYGISIYTVPLFLLTACIYLLAAKKIRVSHALMALGVYLLAAWPFIAVMVINYFKLDTVETALFTLPYFPNSVRSADILLFSPNIPAQLAANLKSLIGIFAQKDGLPWNAVSGFGTVYLFSLPFAIVGLVELMRGKGKAAGRFLLLLFLLTGIFAGLMTNSVNINRANLLFYPLIFLCGTGVYALMRLCGRAKYCIPAAYLLAFAILLSAYFTSYASMISGCFYADFGAAVSSVKDDSADKIYITADTQYVGASNVSEILTLFYHQTDAKYYQGETPAGETPFAEKYIFTSMSAISPDPGENAVYVIKDSDLPLFDFSKFDAESFGGYYVVRPRQSK